MSKTTKRDANDVAREGGPDRLGAELDRLAGTAGAMGADGNGNIFTPKLIRGSDVELETTSWLWEPYIPLGKVAILQGNPGEGKTFIALGAAAIVTRGWPFPGTDGRPGETSEAGSVLYLSCEDGIADTLRPRFDAMGGDPEWITFLQEFTKRNPENGEETTAPVSFQDLPVLRSALQSVRPVLMVADPIQGFFGKGVDLHRANETRPVLAGLGKLAEEFGCAVLCLSHLRKSEADRAIYRGLGSIDIVAAARSVLLTGRDPEHPDRRAIVHIKSSLAEEGPSIGYEIRDGRLEWTGLSDLTAEALFAKAGDDGRRPALETAKAFLREVLDGGAVPKKTVIEEAKALEVKERTLNRAKRELKIESFRRSDGNDGTGKWFWELPEGRKNANV